jgi:predicted HTH transcriptional regulator
LPNINYLSDDLIKEEEESYIYYPQYNKILDYINKNGSITRVITQNILNVGQTRAINILKEMTDAGLIKKVGRGKNTEYLVLGTKK